MKYNKYIRLSFNRDLGLYINFSLVFIVLFVLGITYLQASHSLKHLTDLDNYYKFYISLYNSSLSIFDAPSHYYGRSFEIVLPTISYILTFIPNKLSINEFAFIISLIINILFAVSTLGIVRCTTHVTYKTSIFITFIILLIYPYGTPIQLMRQTLAMSFMFCSLYLLLKQRILWTIVSLIALLTHVGTIAFILFLFCLYFSLHKNLYLNIIIWIILIISPLGIVLLLKQIHGVYVYSLISVILRGDTSLVILTDYIFSFLLTFTIIPLLLLRTSIKRTTFFVICFMFFSCFVYFVYYLCGGLEFFFYRLFYGLYFLGIPLSYFIILSYNFHEKLVRKIAFLILLPLSLSTCSWEIFKLFKYYHLTFPFIS